MVAWPTPGSGVSELTQLRNSPLPDENRASAEVFIARLRVVVSVYCLVLTALGGDSFGFYRRSGLVVAVVFSAYAWVTALVVSRGARRGAPSRPGRRMPPPRWTPA